MFEFIIGVILLCIVWDLSRKSTERDLSGKVLAYVPWSFPIIGSLLDYLPSKRIKNFTKFHRNYGPNYDLFVFGKRMRHVGDATTAREILVRRPKIFRRLNFSGPVNLLTAEGMLWSRLRRLTSPHFSKQNVQSMISVVIEEVNLMTNEITRNIDTPISMDCLSAIYTARVIGRVAIGLKIDEMNEYFGTEKLFEHVKIYLKYLMANANPLLKRRVAVERILSYVIPQQLLPLVDLSKKAVVGDLEFETYCKKHVEKVRRRFESSGGEISGDQHISLIDVFVKESILQSKDKTAIQISDNDVLENVKLLFIAGSETTSAVIAWMCYLLCLHPECKERIRSELKEKIGSKVMPTTHEELSSLEYVKYFVKESIRMYSPAPVATFSLSDDQTQFTLANGMSINSNDLIHINFEGILKDPTVFDSPDEFNPSRWIPTNENAEKLAQMEHNYIPFGGGSRICPGLDLAYLESTLALCALANQFDMKLTCPPAEVNRVLSFTAKPSHVPVLFTRVSA